MWGTTESDAVERIAAAPMTRLTTSTIDVANGYSIVRETPTDLAARAGVNVDVYSCARMIASEDGSANGYVLLALAEAIRNRARAANMTITRRLTISSKNESAGKYSEQAAGKFASTRVDPTYRHVVAALAAINDGTNLTEGATSFFDPRSQDGGVQGGHVLRLGSEDFIRERYSEGLAWVGPLPGIDPYKLMLFGPYGGATHDATLLALEQGRAGDSIIPNVPRYADETTVSFAGIDPKAGLIAALATGGVLLAKYLGAI